MQTGAGVAAGVIVQLRLTIPLNDPAGVTARLNDAVCPAVTVAEFEDPLAVAISEICRRCTHTGPQFAGCLPALSAIFIPAVAFPAAIGLKTTVMVQ